MSEGWEPFAVLGFMILMIILFVKVMITIIERDWLSFVSPIIQWVFTAW